MELYVLSLICIDNNEASDMKSCYSLQVHTFTLSSNVWGEYILLSVEFLSDCLTDIIMYPRDKATRPTFT
jgi:hypothetical protein